MISYSLVGLGLIIVAWAIQLFSKKVEKVGKVFVGIYVAGVLVLVYDGFSSGLMDLAWANLVSAVVAGAIFVRMVLKK